MLGLVVHIFCTFIFATRVVVCWQKKKKEKNYNSYKLNFFLSLEWPRRICLGQIVANIFPDGNSPADYRWLMFSCLEDSFIFSQGSTWPMDRSYKQTKKERKILFKSDLSITSLSWTHWRHSLMWTWSHRQTFSIHPRQTGRVAIAMHSLTGTACV